MSTPPQARCWRPPERARATSAAPWLQSGTPAACSHTCTHAAPALNRMLNASDGESHELTFHVGTMNRDVDVQQLWCTAPSFPLRHAAHEAVRGSRSKKGKSCAPYLLEFHIPRQAANSVAAPVKML